MYKEDLARYLKDLSYLEQFKGQVYLEDILIKGYQKDLMGLKVEEPSFPLKYARLQGMIEGLQILQSSRNIHINSEPNSVNKGKALNV